ncbi:hypothetical protein ACXR2T_10040 [Leucobacter sp. HY1910]
MSTQPATFNRTVQQQTSITIESHTDSNLVGNLTLDDQNHGIVTILDEGEHKLLLRLPAGQLREVAQLMTELASTLAELQVTDLGEHPDAPEEN